MRDFAQSADQAFGKVHGQGHTILKQGKLIMETSSRRHKQSEAAITSTSQALEKYIAQSTHEACMGTDHLPEKRASDRS